MYSARHDFLHGNPVRHSKLFPAKDEKNLTLTYCAVLIYKCALMAFLGMFEKPIPVKLNELARHQVSRVAEQIAEKVAKRFYQRDFELALLNMRRPKGNGADEAF
jgi:transposase